jgi:ABC-type uncharacterized transport system involved in gliding motility auxiliary subunit
MKKIFWSLLAALNIGLYLVLIALWIAIPDELTLNIFSTVACLGLTGVLIIHYRAKFRDFYQSTFFAHFSSASIAVVLILFILGLLNHLAFKNPWQMDLSQRGLNSLTSQTVRILHSTKGELRFVVFAKNSEFPSIRQLLELYRLEKRDVTFEFVDVETAPHLVQEYGVTRSPSVAVVKGDRREIVEVLNELHLTNAVIRVGRDRDPLIYYSRGHDEIDLSAEKMEGGSQLARLLRSSTFDIRPVDLKTFSSLPEGVKAVVIWGPKTGFLPREIEVLDNYLQKGGRLLVALDPVIKGSDNVKDLRDLLKKYGIAVDNNLTIDRARFVNGSNGMVPLVETYHTAHAITQNFAGQTFFPLSGSVRPIGEEGASVEVLATTSPFPLSWADNDPGDAAKGELTFKEGRDFEGPVGLVAALTQEKGAKIVAFGNSSLVSNNYARFPRNFTFVVNALSWLSEEDRLIALDIPSLKEEPFFVSAPQLGVIFYFSVVFAPLALFAIAAFVYRRRVRL